MSNGDSKIMAVHRGTEGQSRISMKRGKVASRLQYLNISGDEALYLAEHLIRNVRAENDRQKREEEAAK